MQEQELYQKIKANDPSAFKELFEMYHQMVFNLCCRMLDNKEEGEDATQEIFINIHKSLNNFRSESKLSTWIYRITVNHCLNRQSRKKLQKWLSLDFISDSEVFRISSRPEQPDTVLEKKEFEMIIQASINLLPRQQRIALMLNRYEGLSYQEIAKIMQCSVSSVESRIYRAKQNLCKRVKPYLKHL